MSTSAPGCLKVLWLGLVSLFGLAVLVAGVYAAAQWSGIVAAVIALGAAAGIMIAVRGQRARM